MKKALEDLFYKKLKFNSATGIDKIRPEVFEKKLKEEIKLISNRIKRGIYKFSPYKELLISKGRNKFPRVISIPTVRDKLSLTWLHKELQAKALCETPKIHKMVSDIKLQLQHGGGFFVKIDITGFYDNINHDLLMSRLRRAKLDVRVLKLISSAIKTATVAEGSKGVNLFNTCGVPQGIPVSNILANFFAIRFDKKMKNNPSIFYRRYVDDIILITKTEKQSMRAKRVLKQVIESSGLKVNEEKSTDGSVELGFDFLGYRFKKKKSIKVSVKETSYRRQYINILKFIHAYSARGTRNPQNQKRFYFDLNLKITGAILEKKRYGWTFFFSQIDDDCEQLYCLDRFIKKQLKCYALPTDKVKSFVRTHKEIKNNLDKTKYIPNFDKFNLGQMEWFLADIVGIKQIDLDVMSPAHVETLFKKHLFKKVRILEKDVLGVS